MRVEKDYEDLLRLFDLGYEPVRVDIITSIKRVNFKSIWNNRKQGVYGRQKVNFVSLKDLIKIKRISRRKQDKVDLEILRGLK